MFVNHLKSFLESVFHTKQLKIWIFVNENILKFDLGHCSSYYVFDVEWIKIN